MIKGSKMEAYLDLKNCGLVSSNLISDARKSTKPVDKHVHHETGLATSGSKAVPDLGDIDNLLCLGKKCHRGMTSCTSSDDVTSGDEFQFIQFYKNDVAITAGKCENETFADAEMVELEIQLIERRMVRMKYVKLQIRIRMLLRNQFIASINIVESKSRTS